MSPNVQSRLRRGYILHAEPVRERIRKVLRLTISTVVNHENFELVYRKCLIGQGC